MEIKELIKLSKKKKWEELAQIANENPDLFELRKTLIQEVAFYGEWNAMTGIFGHLDSPKKLQSTLKKSPELKYVAKIGNGLPIARLHFYAAEKYPESLKVLLDLGFEVNDPSATTPISTGMFPGGRTPIAFALINRSIECAEILLAYGADVHLSDWHKEHALHVTAAKSHLKETEWLLNQGVSPNLQDIDGNTPLHLTARRASSPKTLKLLVEAGGKLDIKNNEGQLPIDLAIEKKKIKNIEFIQSL